MLTQLSNHVADIVDSAAPSVVQVHGQRRPASGVTYAPDLVLTTALAVGREERPQVRAANGDTCSAEVVGWDPSTRLVLLRASGLNGKALTAAPTPRVGNIAIPIARSWSNVVTATAGVISVIGGPLPTGRHREIEQVFRISAPMHEGFAGGGVLGADGGLLGIATAASIRGLGVVIPASIAWATAAELLRRGPLKRGYIGISAQPVSVTSQQKGAAGADEALLVVAVKDGTPAAEAGFLVGDILVSLDGHALRTTDDLFDLLVGDRVGRPVTLRVLRGTTASDMAVTVAER